MFDTFTIILLWSMTLEMSHNITQVSVHVFKLITFKYKVM